MLSRHVRLGGGKGGSDAGQGHVGSCRAVSIICSHGAGRMRNTIVEQRSPTVSWAAERAAPRAAARSVGCRWAGGVLERAVVASGWAQCGFWHGRSVPLRGGVRPFEAG